MVQKLTASKVAVLLAVFIPLVMVASGYAEDDVDFFEKRIRPAILKYCAECHSSDNAEGGLSLKSRQAWMRGGDSGAAIQPNRPEDSLLLGAIEYSDPELQMPPDGRLPKSVIEDFRNWIRNGAFDPREEEPQSDAGKSPKPMALAVEEAQQHWAYRPVHRPAIPTIANSPSSIDAFVEAKLTEAGLRPLAEASRRDLIRRLTFDLHGLPPTADEIDAFVQDESPDAYDRLVDRMIASPRFAERFARRWLDLTRYAESLTLRGFTLPEAWRFRDYVIRSIAEDRPIDQMIREHVAGDLMQNGDVDQRAQRMIAASFLTLGNTNLEEQDKVQLEMDVVDEMLDTMGRAFMAQTIGCARCHDHKFDPIPTKDYYALAGILKSSKLLQHDNVSKWIERPLPLDDEQASRFREMDEAAAKMQSRIAELEKLLKPAANGGRIVAVEQLAGRVVDTQQAKKVGAWLDSSSVPSYVGDGYVHDQNNDKGTKSITFEPEGLAGGVYEVRLAYAHGDNRASNVPVSVFSADGETQRIVDQRKPGPIEGLWISLGEFRFEENGQAYVLVSNEATDGHVIADAVQFLPVGQSSTVASEAVEGGKLADVESELAQLKKDKAKLDGERARRPKAMGFEEQQPVDLAVHVRGSVHNLGEVVPRGFMRSVPVSTTIALPNEASGRLEMADWLTHESNPLTTRVMANRIWYWVMDEGLVSTVDNFGTTGEAPSHPELLDWLTSEMIRQDWSMKRLVKEIVSSQAYRRAIDLPVGHEASSQYVTLDPQNRLLWRSNRKRLDAESMRDAMLTISGELDLGMYGRRWETTQQADYGFRSPATCRSVYVPAFRNALPELFEAFDFVNLSVGVGKRNRSTVAQQALFLMNNPWIRERSEQGARLLVDRANDPTLDLPDEVVTRVLGRSATEPERKAILEFVRTQHGGQWTSEAVADIMQSLLSSVDFRFLP